MNHAGSGGFPRNRQYKGFGDGPETSGGGHEERLNEGKAQSIARDKDQSSPKAVHASHKEKSPIDCGGRLAGA